MNAFVFESAQPFGHWVVGVELLGSEGLVVALSAYLRHSTEYGLLDLDKACRWAKAPNPCIIVGMDGNKQNPCWGPLNTRNYPMGEMIDNLNLELDLEIVNHHDCPPTCVSNMGYRAWIVLTLRTCSRLCCFLAWSSTLGQYMG